MTRKQVSSTTIEELTVCSDLESWIPWTGSTHSDISHGFLTRLRIRKLRGSEVCHCCLVTTRVIWLNRTDKSEPTESLFKFKYTWEALKPDPPEEKFTLGNQILRTFFTSWINALLLCVPTGLILVHVGHSTPATFAINYLAQIPLWFMCDYSLEEIEKYIGVEATDLLDLFTTNTVQIISSILLLRAHEVDLLQTSLVGGILSNILVLLGLSISFGGIMNLRHSEQHEQHFNRLGAQGFTSLLSIAATSILIPTAVKLLGQTSNHNLVLQSRGVALILLFVYLSYSFCQYWTHRHLYRNSGKPPAPTVSISAEPANLESSTSMELTAAKTLELPSPRKRRSSLVSLRPNSPRPVSVSRSSADDGPSDYEIRGPQLDLPVAMLCFSASIILLYFCIDATVNSITALTAQTSLTPTFVGLILLPIPNCDFAPISLAVDDQLEQTMRYTVGRSIQTALLVEPFVVLLAWGMHVPNVTLAFDGFEVVSLFTTILLLNFLVVDAKVHWVHGILLLADWVLIGIAAYFVQNGDEV